MLRYEVRRETVLSLGKLEPKDLREYIDALKKLIADKHERVRKATRQVLEDSCSHLSAATRTFC